MAPKETALETIEEDAPKTEELRLLSLEILKVIRNVQQQHGLRHGDYQRYRGYCSRRIRRLRKVLKIPQGDRRHFKRKDVMETHLYMSKADERYLHVPLVCAERAWAYAMQLRQEANTEPRKKFHLIHRMRKACTYAMQLQELCKSARCDARTKLEAQAYVAWMEGTLQFELQLWSQAAENLKKAQVVYEQIANTLPDDEQSPYRHRVDELAPSLRYCAYNIGDEKAVDLLELRGQGLIENLDTLMAQVKEKRSEDIFEVNWQHGKVIVRNEKIKLFLLSIQELDATLERADDNQARIALLEQMLIDCRDAVNLAREEVRLGTVGAQLLLTYLLYIRLSRTVQRNEYLLAQTRKQQDVIRMYEIMLQQVAEMKQLAGMEENQEYQKELDLRMMMYRAFRHYHLAKACATTRKWREALFLYNKSEQDVQKLLSEKTTPDHIHKKIQPLRANLETDEIVARAQCVIEETDEPSVVPVKSSKIKKPLIDRLDLYVEDTQLLTQDPNVVELPPALEPIPCKPMFFDLAFNFVKFPDLQDKLEGQQGKANAASGMSGFVKGLFGWGGKKQ